MKRLRIIKNIELQKSNSLSNLSMSEKLGSNRDKNNKSLQKIYNYYSSKSKIKEKLIYQKILLMKKELKKKQNEEKNIFKYNFYKKYPPENFYANNEINYYLKEINRSKMENDLSELRKFEKMKNEILKKKHEEYMKKMGMDYENELMKLKEKFRREQEEQTFTIKKIILNHRLGEIENQKEDKTMHIIKPKGVHPANYLYKYYYSNRNNEKNKKTTTNRLSSKIFSFGVGGNLYKTILI